MIGAAGGAICMYYIGGYIAVAQPAKNPTGTLDGGGISALVFFYIWTAFYGPTWNPTPWVINSEIFPQEVRGVAQACGAASNWLYNFAISQATPHMFNSWGYGVYLFFASLMVLSVIFVFFMVPETKGIPVESMDELFNKRPRWRAHSIMVEELRIRAGERIVEQQHSGQVDMRSRKPQNHSGSPSLRSDEDKEDKTRTHTEA